MPNTDGLPENIGRILHTDPLKYNITDNERAALSLYQDILSSAKDEGQAKSLFNSLQIRNEGQAVTIDNILGKLTPQNILTSAAYNKLKAKHSGIIGTGWYNLRSYWNRFADLFRKEPEKTDSTKEKDHGWLEKLAENKFLGMNTAKLLGGLGFLLTLAGVAAAIAVILAIAPPFGLMAIAGGVATLTGTGLGLVNNEAADIHDDRKTSKDDRIKINDVYKVQKQALAEGKMEVATKANGILNTLLHKLHGHYADKFKNGTVVTTQEKVRFALKALCGALGLAGPITSGATLFNIDRGLITDSVVATAGILSAGAASVSSASNGLSLHHKHMEHQANVAANADFKYKISHDIASANHQLTSKVPLHHKVTKWHKEFIRKNEYDIPSGINYSSTPAVSFVEQEQARRNRNDAGQSHPPSGRGI